LNNAGGAYPSSAPQDPQAANAWAWSPQGVQYALAGIQKAAGGLRGAPAVEAIVRRFERPAAPNAEISKALAGQQVAAPAGATPAAASPWAGLAEAFYDPQGSYDNGRFGGPIGGHSDHVHVSETNPQQMIRAIQLAGQMGLSAGENPYTGNPADPGVHVADSYHYRDFPGTYSGKQLGEGLDVSGGTPSLLARYYNTVTGRAGGTAAAASPSVEAPRTLMSAPSVTAGRRPLPAAVRQALEVLRS
jgi:hypothetical protein